LANERVIVGILAFSSLLALATAAAPATTCPRGAGFESESLRTSLPPALVTYGIAVVRNAARFGLKKAGVYLMGNKWAPFEWVLSPLIDRFPDLLKAGPAAKAVAPMAERALLEDSRLIQQMDARFAQLETSQQLILSRLEDHEAQLADLEEQLDAIYEDHVDLRSRVGVLEQQFRGQTPPRGGELTLPSCEFANDGECDEPALCAPGSDTNDCSTPAQEDISGRWLAFLYFDFWGLRTLMGQVVFVFERSSAETYRYAQYNLAGILESTGGATASREMVSLRGVMALLGEYSGSLHLSGAQMEGVITLADGTEAYLTLSR